MMQRREASGKMSSRYGSKSSKTSPMTRKMFVDASEVHGRRDVADAVIKQLIEDAGDEEKNGPLVISIVGTGGIGKTTLAQLVYGDRAIKERFDIMMWICVSQPFDEIKIAKAIVESTTEKSSDLSLLETLLKEIRSSLSSKKFLLVLDDVWTERSEQWDPFRNALKVGHSGSRILVTTRSEVVARMMGTVHLRKLDPISDEDSWLLFSRMAFSGRSEEDCRELNDIGKNIVQKCKGLPLAVKVMGSLLQLKDTEEEWQNVLDSKIWELEKAETELFPHLYLSYEDLTPTTKRCLLYCAIFPKDDVMKAETLIRMWMAQGYLTTTNGSNHNQMEQKGQEIFRNLAMRSFFQDLEKDDTNSKIIKSCKMHDIVHDFVQFLTKDECYSLSWGKYKVEIENLRHLSTWHCSKELIHGIGKVRTFFTGLHFQVEPIPNLFNALTSVRVLQLHTYRLKELPKEIGNLLHLRYIGLWGCIKLIDAICSLYNLQTLDLERCEYLSRLPEGIGELINLRRLNLRGCKKLETLPQGITKLTQLHTLDLGGCKGLSRLPEGIGNLINLRRLDLSRCEELEMLPQGITKLTQLRTLDLQGCWRLSTLPEGIGKLTNLRHLNLSICGKLEMLPQGIAKLTQLRTLDLGRCRHLSRLPEGIGNLTNLRHLNLSECSSLKMLPQGITKLTQLRTLGIFVVGKEGCELGDMEKLKQLQGRLEIVFRSPLNNTTDVEEAEKAGLRNKENLNELTLEFDRHIEVSIDVMEALKPPLKLQSLGIIEYGGTQLPSWITRSLDNLRSLQIMGCCNCTSLPPLGKLPSLETLSICDMKSLKRVGNDFLGVPEVAVAFPKLKKLHFSGCEEWDGLRVATNVMPCLTDLSLWNCSKLKTMPPLGKLPSLESLTIWGMDSLKRVGSEFLGVPEVAVAFPKLKTLYFTNCSEWEEWDGLREATNVMPRLTHLSLWNCSKLKSMPPLGKFPSLESLSISYMESLKRVGIEFLGVPEVAVAFPKLKKLHFSHCEEWEEWDGLREATNVMPCLTELTLYNCSKLKTVPFHLLGKMSALQSLTINKCPNLEVDESELSHIRRVYID